MGVHDNSLIAWVKSVYANLQDREKVVLEFIEHCGDHGATIEEAAVGLKTKDNRISGRFTGLKSKCRIVKSGERKTSSGCFADVYVINKFYVPELEIKVAQEKSGQFNFMGAAINAA